MSGRPGTARFRPDLAGVAYPVRPGIPGQRNIARHHPPLPAGTSRPLPAGPGLREALGSSGLATDFTQPASLARALSKVVNSESIDKLDVTFNWSRVAAAPRGTPREVEFNRDAMAIVERVSDKLKTSTYSRESVLFGLVTHLNRHPDDETGRGGVQALIQRRSRTVWMDLPDANYHEAVRCHDSGTPVRVRGVLNSPPGGAATMQVADFGRDPSLGP